MLMFYKSAYCIYLPHIHNNIIIHFHSTSTGAELLTGAFTDFYSGPVYSGRLNCSESMYSLSNCQLSPGGDESCGTDPSRAVGFRCVRGVLIN